MITDEMINAVRSKHLCTQHPVCDVGLKHIYAAIYPLIRAQVFEEAAKVWDAANRSNAIADDCAQAIRALAIGDK